MLADSIITHKRKSLKPAKVNKLCFVCVNPRGLKPVKASVHVFVFMTVSHYHLKTSQITASKEKINVSVNNYLMYYMVFVFLRDNIAVFMGN